MTKYKKHLMIATGGLCFILLIAFGIKINQSKSEEKAMLAYQDSALLEEDQKETFEADLSITASGNSVNEGMTIVDQNIEKDSISNEPIEESIIKDINILVKSYYDTSKKLSEDMVIVDDLATLSEIEESRKAIEQYKNIVTYVKHGIEQGSYVTFITYEMKLEHIETLAPGMSMLYIVTSEDGSLRIKDNIDEEQVNTYVSKLIESDDLKPVVEEINHKLSQAVAKDKKLKEFIQYLEKDM